MPTLAPTNSFSKFMSSLLLVVFFLSTLWSNCVVRVSLDWECGFGEWSIDFCCKRRFFFLLYRWGKWINCVIIILDIIYNEWKADEFFFALTLTFAIVFYAIFWSNYLKTPQAIPFLLNVYSKMKWKNNSLSIDGSIGSFLSPHATCG